ncbi:phenylalanine--tRNA ligase subunit beta [Pajaroellobacter abortibovis]|uniref:Phenylalanine--tRNA ligase beta subunit n=1 Tax=Pajaroellobacter abortibovis TaxID=1882918 RepID=A0A1L6MVU4_9BACT|nr:phenylalanine--tRNA ligase subunit beta [Pajaroellobacter abortibovis]
MQWLCSLVPQLPPEPCSVAERLTSAGIEVEDIEHTGVERSPCLFAQVLSVTFDPSSPKTRKLMLDVGGGEYHPVVQPHLGEVKEGEVVVVAPSGSPIAERSLPMPVKKEELQEWVVCTQAALDIADATGAEKEEILVLPPSFAEPGTPFVQVVPSAQDTILSLNLTPNRSDGLGHVGLARELSVLYQLPWSLPELPSHVSVEDFGEHSPVSLILEEGAPCFHYAGAVLLDVQIVPSPLWVRCRLAALGMRPISSMVDLTNLAMLEWGNPLHAFNLRRISGRTLHVRTARERERIQTIDGKECILHPQDLVIADAQTPVALAGVIGGKDSEISADTCEVFLESAHFDPRSVRRTACRHGYHTEASHRFERGIDPSTVIHALTRVVTWAVEWNVGRLGSPLLSRRVRKPPASSIRFRPARAQHLLGLRVSDDQAAQTIKGLGFDVVEKQEEIWTLVPPSHRPDVSHEVDVIEEIGRIYGIQKIEPIRPSIIASTEGETREKSLRQARSIAVEMGLLEAVTHSFTSARALESIGAPPPSVVLENPLHEFCHVMRTSLLPGLFEAVARARRVGECNVRMFTLGSIFLEGSQGGLPEEKLMLAAVLAGDREAYLQKPQPVDSLDGKGLAVRFLQRWGCFEWEIITGASTQSRSTYHPLAYARIQHQGCELGTFGLIHPDVEEAFGLQRRTVLVELDLAALHTLKRSVPHYTPPPRYPAVLRDMALVVSTDIPAGLLEKAIREVAGPLLESVQLFDRFTGGNLPPHHVSLAFHLVYRNLHRTLVDEEVDILHAHVVTEVIQRFDAALRAS